MAYEYAKTVLREEAFKLGGELFAEEAVKHSLKIVANEGNEEAKKQLEIAEFTQSIFSGFFQESEKAKQFYELIEAIALLIRLDDEKK